MTKYKILQESDDNAYTVVAGGIEARSAVAAIRQYVDDPNVEVERAVFVAVPERSWSRHPVAVQTTQRLFVG